MQQLNVEKAVAGMFSIGFDRRDEGNRVAIGSVRTDEFRESFESDLEILGIAEYESHWRSAIKISVEERRTTCLITDLSVGHEKIGDIMFFSLIPSELARGAVTYDGVADGFFLTQTMWAIATDPNCLRSRRFVELVDGTVLAEQAVYYLDPHEPDRLFPYLDDSISNISNWFIQNDALISFLERQRT